MAITRNPLRSIMHKFRKASTFHGLRILTKKLLLNSRGIPHPGCVCFYHWLKSAGRPKTSPGDMLRKLDKLPQLYPMIHHEVRAYCEPRIAVITVAHNQGQYAHDALRHFCALFDLVIVIDHMSNDDTAQIVRGYNGIEQTTVILLRAEDQDYLYSQYATSCANILLQQGSVDWIFFLDFDEFLPFSDAHTFHQALAGLAVHPLIRIHWHTITLHRKEADTLQGAKGNITGPRVSSLSKIAINTRLCNSGFVISQGYHSIRFPGSTQEYFGIYAFCLYHIHSFMEQKKKFSETVRDKIFSEDTVTLTSAQCQKVDPVIDFHENTHCFGFTLENIDDVMRKALVDVPMDCAFGEHPASLMLPEPFYPALPEIPHPHWEPKYILLSIISTIRSWRWSDNDVHLPFFLTLLDIFRPCRYVEIAGEGSAYALEPEGSFFAACQHMKDNNFYGEAIAVSDWENVAHTVNQNNFEDFKTTLQASYTTVGRFIRGKKRAYTVFENKSIDMLCIDIYQDTRINQIFSKWHKKLTSDSVVVFRNINNFNTAGMIKSLGKVAQASFQFYRGSGLAVLAFGDPKTNPVIPFLQMLAEDAVYTEYFFVRLANERELALKQSS